MREKVEEKGLYLLQLWADTFMMYQEQYPGFQRYYRELKVEGVKFPEREIIEKTLMDNLEGIDSPMFDFIEQAEKLKSKQTPTKKSISSNERNSNASAGKKSPDIEARKSLFAEAEAEDKIDEDPETELQEINAKIRTLEEQKDYVEDDYPAFIEEVDNEPNEKYQDGFFQKEAFYDARKNIEMVETMLLNCESYTDICTNSIVELYENTLKSKYVCMRITKVAKCSWNDEFRMNALFNDYKEKYYNLKEKEIRQYYKAKRQVEKAKRKMDKKKEKADRRLKRKEAKMEARRKAQLEDANPFDVQDSQALDMKNPDETNISDDSEESSDSSLSESSSDDEDNGGLHVPKSLNDYELKKMEKRRQKEYKRKEKEYKKKLKEKSRSSKLSSNGGGNKEGGFLRNSVLVQKTLNFFGRKSKPLLVKNSDEDLDVEDQGFQRKSDYKPNVQDFFVETANKNGSQSSEKENVFETANKEKDIEFFQNEENEDASFEPDFDAEAEEQKSPENKPIFNYGRKHSIGLPPMHKASSKVTAKPPIAKKLVAPPKPSNKFRHSVLEKPDLLDLLEN